VRRVIEGGGGGQRRDGYVVGRSGCMFLVYFLCDKTKWSLPHIVEFIQFVSLSVYKLGGRPGEGGEFKSSCILVLVLRVLAVNFKMWSSFFKFLVLSSWFLVTSQLPRRQFESEIACSVRMVAVELR